MFHPVGPQQSSVYWRRRLVLIGSIAVLAILLVLTVKIAASDGGGSNNAGGRTSTPLVTSPIASTSHSASTSRPPSTRTSRSAATSTTVASPRCAPTDLSVAAITAMPSYHVGDQPVVELQVTNTGPQPCVQDLADRQVELKVYNGESRVWGSHDCQIQPGTNVKMLAVNTPVRVAITWSGLSSQPGCAGTRQRVGAGTYTLYAFLSGRSGKAAQFTIS